MKEMPWVAARSTVLHNNPCAVWRRVTMACSNRAQDKLVQPVAKTVPVQPRLEIVPRQPGHPIISGGIGEGALDQVLEIGGRRLRRPDITGFSIPDNGGNAAHRRTDRRHA